MFGTSSAAVLIICLRGRLPSVSFSLSMPNAIFGIILFFNIVADLSAQAAGWRKKGHKLLDDLCLRIKVLRKRGLLFVLFADIVGG